MNKNTSLIITLLFTGTIVVSMICIILNMIFSKQADSSSTLKDKLELYTNDNIILHDFLVENASAYDKFLGWEVYAVSEYNSVIFLDDDYLAGRMPKLSDDTIFSLVESISGFNDILFKQNVPLLYVQAPSKICTEDAANNVLDFSDDNTSRLLTELLKKNIACLDLHPIFHSITNNHHSLYYKTDHHWKAETGLLTAGIICDYLNTSYDFQIDTSLFEPENYQYEVYQNYFLGSQGKKVTMARTAPEDFTLIYPKEDLHLSLQIPAKNINTNGSFSILYDYQYINNSDYYKYSPYSAYFHSDNAYTHLVNHDAINDKKVLILGDSFENCVTPFLSLGIHSIDAIDLRYFKESLIHFLEQNNYNYDIVIILYNPGQFAQINWDSHESLWDFR